MLCIGGGPTGVEAASYIKETYIDKRVGLCQKGDKLIPDHPGAHDVAHRILNKIGVAIHMETPYSTEDPIDRSYEYKLDCRGFRFTGPSKFLQGEMR